MVEGWEGEGAKPGFDADFSFPATLPIFAIDIQGGCITFKNIVGSEGGSGPESPLKTAQQLCNGEQMFCL